MKAVQCTNQRVNQVHETVTFTDGSMDSNKKTQHTYSVLRNVTSKKSLTLDNSISTLLLVTLNKGKCGGVVIDKEKQQILSQC